jgi:ABC-type glycerol-3-phosphate transport system permease component
MKIESYRLLRLFSNLAVYFLLTVFALIMLFPFMYMLATSFKLPADSSGWI